MRTDMLQKPRYQDDNYFVGKLTEMADSWEPLLAQMSADGNEINLRKSELWIPAGEALSMSCFPMNMHGLLDALPAACGGIEVMGGAAQGEC